MQFSKFLKNHLRQIPVRIYSMYVCILSMQSTSQDWALVTEVAEWYVERAWLWNPIGWLFI